MKRTDTLEDVAIAALQSLLRKGLVPFGFVGAVAAGTAAWVDNKAQINELSRAVVRDREVCDARKSDSDSFHRFGRDGFSNPETAAGLDASFRRFLQGYDAERDRRLLDAVNSIANDAKLRWMRFFDVNPTLIRPTE